MGVKTRFHMQVICGTAHQLNLVAIMAINAAQPAEQLQGEFFAGEEVNALAVAGVGVMTSCEQGGCGT